MRDQNASPRIAVAQFAAREHGVATHDELIDLGLSASAIGRWAGSGGLHRVHRGVYAIGRPGLSVEGRALAAVKACGPDAVLSHGSAAALWDLRRGSSPVVHVTTPGRRSPRGLTVHRVRQLDREDRALRDGIPVTSVARTALDCAETMAPRELTRLLEQAERLGLFNLIAIQRVLERSPGRRGAKPLRAALTQMEPEPPRVNSDWERDLLDFCADIGVPKPELTVIVEGYEVDALWREKKLIVELDSWTFHRSRRAFVEDRRRLAVLQLAGYLALPITALDSAAARLLSAAVAAR
jgi:hypothetical protein